MSFHNWKHAFLTIPNFLSLSRILLIPVYANVFVGAETKRDYILAGGILCLSCLTDFADGFVARRYHMTSNVGKLLDPMADKLTQLTLIVCLCNKHALLMPVFILFLIKEAFQLIAFFFSFHIGTTLSGALWEGKLCTAVLFASFIVLVMFPEINPFVADLLILTDGVVLSISFLSYCSAYYHIIKETPRKSL